MENSDTGNNSNHSGNSGGSVSNPQGSSKQTDPNPNLGGDTALSGSAPFVSKLAFCWLALLTGVVGGHWFVAGRNKRALLYLLCMPLSAFAGWAECMRFGLMPDDQFNQRFNPDYPVDTRQTTGLVVTSIGLALAAFVTALMSLLAVVFQMILAGYVA